MNHLSFFFIFSLYYSRERNFRAAERKEDERWVVSSNSDSEWRQKRNCWNPNPRVGKALAARKDDWNKVWDTNNGTLTYFFKNFPDTWNANALMEIFNKVEPVLDVFIPNRKGNDGQRFGFVSFRVNIDKPRVEKMQITSG